MNIVRPVTNPADRILMPKLNGLSQTGNGVRATGAAGTESGVASAAGFKPCRRKWRINQTKNIIKAARNAADHKILPRYKRQVLLA